MRRLAISLFILGLVLGTATSAGAQQQNLSFATLYNADYSTFPTASLLLDAFDTNGIFASGLKPEAVSVTENGQQLPVDSLTEMAIPLQLVVAVNQGEPLDVRDATSFSRFQRASQVISQWAQTLPADLPDDFSLVSQAGPVINHATASEFISGLNAFQPDFRAATPNLQSLAIALDTVSAQTPRLGMKRAILFITPSMNDANLAAAMEPLLQRAVQNHIRVFVWFIDLETTFTTTSAAVFNTLALQTGGSMFTYSGIERFPDLEGYFLPLRRVYTASFSSRLSTGGEHMLSVQVKLPSGAQVTSNEQKINLDIQPPNPIPLTSSLQITRQPPAEDPYNTEILLPTEQVIEIIVEFPDQHPRPLTRTTLYVDGQIVDENTTEPFDKFTWDLTSYTTSGPHQLSVEVVDSLGLSKASMASPIAITVIQPPRGPAAFLAKYRNYITIAAIVFAGIALTLILASGRLRMPSIRAAQEARRAEADPLTQSVQVVKDAPAVAVAAPTAKPKKPRAKPKKKEPDTKSRKEADAVLMRISEDGQPLAVTPIAVLEKEITFGTDPVQCNQILDDASIASVHARLRKTEDGNYLLQDNGSIAGTWVNYEPVPREGYRLMHGDMVNFGRLIYRFTLRTPPQGNKPKITVQTIEE
jgi:hypothetical protein